nr:hypothetical protein [Nanoarchaeum sp.]
MRNKNNFILLVVVFFVLSSVSASSEPLLSGECSLSISMINQEPYPAIPGEYVDVVFQVSGVASNQCDGALFELIQSYPFSLDDDNGLRILDDSTYIKDYDSDWMIAYKIRVDEDALDGTSTLKIHYTPGTSNLDSYVEKTFDIEIEDSRTSFDAVIQETTASETAIAIANIGKYTANSVVVRIPEQDYFKATSTSGQMVGNLEAGDYTVVNFALTKLPSKDQETSLKFDIYYTDGLGLRRTVNMEIPMGSESNSLPNNISVDYQEFGGRNMPRTNSNNTYLTLAIIILGLGLVFLLYKKKRKKIKNIFKKFKRNSNTNQNENLNEPTWVKHQKEGVKGK